MIKINVLGDAFVDIVATNLKGIPTWGGDERASSIAVHVGGSALNTAVHLKSLLQDQAKVSMFTALGKDDFAQNVLMNKINKVGIDLQATMMDGENAGVCLVLSCQDERSFVTCPGAIEKYALRHINKELLADCHHLHFGGVYALNSLIDDFAELLRDVRRKNPDLTISLDTNFDSTNLWGSNWGRNGISESLTLIDIVKLNDTEAQGIFEKNCPVDEQPHYSAIAWLASKVRFCAIETRAEMGAICCFSNDIKSTYSVSSHPVIPVDPTGCGDAFTAGFLSRWLCDKSDTMTALKTGCLCGALALTFVGACASPLTKEKLESLTKKSEEEEDKHPHKKIKTLL